MTVTHPPASLDAPDSGPGDHDVATSGPQPGGPVPESPKPVTRTLPPGWLACQDCGQAVNPANAPTAPVTLGTVGRHGAPGTVQVSTCADCQQLHELAARLVDQHPRLSATLGEGPARGQTLYALVALQVLGSELPEPDSGALGVLAVRGLQRHLAGVGAAMRWATRLAPVPTVGVATCAAEPWAHLRDQTALLADARAALVGWLSERRERATETPAGGGAVAVELPPVPDPQLAGCLLCGVASVLVDAEEMRSVGGLAAARSMAWRPVVISSPSVIGGPPSPDAVRGYVCANCAVAVADAGAIGHAAMVLALRRHLSDTGRPDEAARLAGSPNTVLVGLCGWAGWVLRSRRSGRRVPAPNREPWAHVEVA